MTDPIVVVIPIYEGVTQIDFTGPHQLLSRVPNTSVVVASVGGKPVTAEGLTFASLADLGAIETCTVLCVPGGLGCATAMRDPTYMAAIRRLASGARYVTSVCTGSLILGAAGLIVGKRAACHWAWRDLLPEFGAIPDAGRVVRDGNVLTGGGVTAGLDFGLTLIAELAGAEEAQAVQLALEYAPAPPFAAGTPETAPPSVREAVLSRMARILPERRREVLEAAAAIRASA